MTPSQRIQDTALRMQLLTNPADPTERNVFADWLVDLGRDEEAESVRRPVVALVSPVQAFHRWKAVFPCHCCGYHKRVAAKESKILWYCFACFHLAGTWLPILVRCEACGLQRNHRFDYSGLGTRGCTHCHCGSFLHIPQGFHERDDVVIDEERP